MQFGFRADASATIGIGHIMRCLTLAKRLSRAGHQCHFFCCPLPGNIEQLISGNGFEVSILPAGELATTADQIKDAANVAELVNGHLPTGFDWIIVDHYKLSRPWGCAIRSCCRQVAVIDDLADRVHDCELLLDQNLYDNEQARYTELVPAGCKTFLGSRYALLRDEFYELTVDRSRARTGVKHLVISFGGADSTDETSKCLEALSGINGPELKVSVVVGGANPRKEKIMALCAANANFTYYCQIDFMAQLMNSADLFIGAGGTTTWERCYLRLPSITLVIADNQRETTEVLARRGGTLNLGWAADVTKEQLRSAILSMMNSSTAMDEMRASLEDLACGEGTDEIIAALTKASK